MSFFSKLGDFGRGLVEGAPAGIQIGLNVADSRRQKQRLDRSEARANRGEARADTVAEDRKREELRREFQGRKTVVEKKQFVTEVEQLNDPSLSQLIAEFQSTIREQSQSELQGVQATGTTLRGKSDIDQSVTASGPIPTSPERMVAWGEKLRTAAGTAQKTQQEVLTALDTAESLGQGRDALGDTLTAFQESSDAEDMLLDKAEILEAAQSQVAQYLSLGSVNLERERQIRESFGDSFSASQVSDFMRGLRSIVAKSASDNVLRLASIDPSLLEEKHFEQVQGIVNQDFIRALSLRAQEAENREDFKELFAVFMEALNTGNYEGARAMIPSMVGKSTIVGIEDILNTKIDYASLKIKPDAVAEMALRLGINQLELNLPPDASFEDIYTGVSDYADRVNTGREKILGQDDANKAIELVNRQRGGKARYQEAVRLTDGFKSTLSNSDYETLKNLILGTEEVPIEFKTTFGAGTGSDKNATPTSSSQDMGRGPNTSQGSSALLGANASSAVSDFMQSPDRPSGRGASRARDLARQGKQSGGGARIPPSSAARLLPRIPIAELGGQERARMVENLRAAGVKPNEMKTITLDEARRRLNRGAIPTPVPARTDSILGGLRDE